MCDATLIYRMVGSPAAVFARRLVIAARLRRRLGRGCFPQDLVGQALSYRMGGDA